MTLKSKLFEGEYTGFVDQVIGNLIILEVVSLIEEQNETIVFPKEIELLYIDILDLKEIPIYEGYYYTVDFSGCKKKEYHRSKVFIENVNDNLNQKDTDIWMYFKVNINLTNRINHQNKKSANRLLLTQKLTGFICDSSTQKMQPKKGDYLKFLEDRIKILSADKKSDPIMDLDPILYDLFVGEKSTVDEQKIRDIFKTPNIGIIKASNILHMSNPMKYAIYSKELHEMLIYLGHCKKMHSNIEDYIEYAKCTRILIENRLNHFDDVEDNMYRNISQAFKEFNLLKFSE